MEKLVKQDRTHGVREGLCLYRTTFDDQMPLLKTWKVKSGDSTCMPFNGKECK